MTCPDVAPNTIFDCQRVRYFWAARATVTPLSMYVLAIAKTFLRSIDRQTERSLNYTPEFRRELAYVSPHDKISPVPAR